MALASNPFSGLPAVTIAALKADFLQCLTDIARAGQSYTINSRTYTGADMDAVKDTIRQLQEAQDYQAGTIKTRAYPIFRNRGY